MWPRSSAIYAWGTSAGAARRSSMASSSLTAMKADRQKSTARPPNATGSCAPARWTRHERHLDTMSAYESRPWLHLYRSDIPADLETPPETALDSFLAIARQHPERTFLDDGGNAITYGETASKATAFAAALLDSGIERGDRVAVYLQNRPEFAFAQLGIWSAGAVQVPLNPMMRSQELHHLLTDSGTRTLVTQDDLWELAGREGAVSAGVGSAFVVGDVAPGDGVQRWTEALTAF